MASIDATALGREWTTLHDSHEQIEKSALLIKLAGVIVCALGVAALLPPLPAGALLWVLWVQEAIGRTGQARLAERILRIESLLAQGDAADSAAYRLYGEWLAGRPGTAGLIVEYARNALRPTVAFPYAVLIALLLPAFV